MLLIMRISINVTIKFKTEVRPLGAFSYEKLTKYYHWIKHTFLKALFFILCEFT